VRTNKAATLAVTKVNPVVRERIIELNHAGYTQAEIAKDLKLNPRTVARYYKIENLKIHHKRRGGNKRGIKPRRQLLIKVPKNQNSESPAQKKRDEKLLLTCLIYDLASGMNPAQIAVFTGLDVAAVSSILRDRPSWWTDDCIYQSKGKLHEYGTGNPTGRKPDNSPRSGRGDSIGRG
jgi:transcriptional regulator with XRE-family HTH domain